MTDEHGQAPEQQKIREHFRAVRDELARVSDEEWAAERDAEMRTVTEWAAAQRRNAA